MGEVKFLKSRINGKIRLVMRRDQTLKVCANHLSTLSRRPGATPVARNVADLAFARRVPCVGARAHTVMPEMKLTPNVGSDRSWVWNVLADMAEGTPTKELLAIRFANTESASP